MLHSLQHKNHSKQLLQTSGPRTMPVFDSVYIGLQILVSVTELIYFHHRYNNYYFRVLSSFSLELRNVSGNII